MSIFREFETHVLRLLVASELGPKALEIFLREAELVSYTFSASGYFLTVRHSVLPKERLVCAKPHVIGCWNGIESGFVVFIENAELTLECHGWGAMAIPPDYRDQAVSISVS